MWADDVVTLSLQYSTQWDSLAHVGAEFDADGDGVEEAVYYNGYRAGIDLVGPQADAAGDGGSHRCFAHHLGLEHMAYPGVQGRGVLVDLAHHLGHDWRGVDLQTLKEIMAADNVVVEPGDMLLLHTGFATEVLKWNRDPDPVKIHMLCTYLDARDESLLQWISDSQISALVADNYAVEGLARRDRDESRHSFLPIHHLCLFRLGVPLGEMWYLHELAAWLREHRPEPVPAHRAPAAPARNRRLPAHPGRHRLIAKVSLSRCPRRSRLRDPRDATVERLVVAVEDPLDLLEELRPAARVQEILARLTRDVGAEVVAALPERGHGRAGVDHLRPALFGGGVHFDGVVAVVPQVDEDLGDEVDLVAVVPRIVAGRRMGATGEEQIGETGRHNAEERLRTVRPVVLERETIPAADPQARQRPGSEVEPGRPDDDVELLHARPSSRSPPR